MNHEDFVTYEQAVKLKEIGFNYPTSAYYWQSKTDLYFGELLNRNNEVEYKSAPTLAQAQKWLRKKGVEVNACGYFEEDVPTGKWMAYYRKLNQPLYAMDYVEENYDTYEQALSAGIDQAIELLKQQSNGNQD